MSKFVIDSTSRQHLKMTLLEVYSPLCCNIRVWPAIHCDLMGKTRYNQILQPDSLLQGGGEKKSSLSCLKQILLWRPSLHTLPAERWEECTLSNISYVILGWISGTSTCSTEHQINKFKQNSSACRWACKLRKSVQLLPAKARVSWCSWWEEKRMVGLMSFVVKFSHGGVNSVCLSVDCISISSITWKSWGYLSGESQASSSGLNGDKSCTVKKGKDISAKLHEVFQYVPAHRLFHLWIFSFSLHKAFMLQVWLMFSLKYSLGEF